MMRYSFLFLLLNLFFIPCFAQTNEVTQDKELAYIKTINTRADKIVATLGITDASRASRVKNIIANQYRNLNTIYTDRDVQIKSAKSKATDDKEVINAQVQKINAEADSKVTGLHSKYLNELSKELSLNQVDKIKDGMTYDVLHVTYNGYNQMILTLTDAQKQQIMTWLIEAREHAMDAESSEKKHAWFGKYKGRINNYLSAQGYDLNKEGKDWEKRRNDEKALNGK